MPDLATQIGTLYQVISQFRPASGSSGRRPAQPDPQDEVLRPACAIPQKTWRQIARHWICALYCLWFSLPLSIWLSSGWIGLLFYWQALSRAACLVEKLMGKPKLALAGFDSGEGDVQ
jgi:hypothetical protein